MPIKDIPANFVPYISEIDLIVFKINSCGLRAHPPKMITDAMDAQNMLQLATTKSPLNLTATQQDVVEAGLESVIENGNKSERWWRQRLGMLKPN